MISQQDRINYWEALSISHHLVLHNADILDGIIVIGHRNSFIVDIADELEASEIINLQFPCVVANLVAGKVILKDDQPRIRYQNKITFLSRFSITSDADPSIPDSKKSAFDITYEVLKDFLNKIVEDYDDMGPCGDFRFIDENSYRWEPVELAGSNMCGWALYFNDEEAANFIVDETKWN
ncbi:MAG: hypothetical protein ABI921_12460 [Panacibacter sp.]